jgi:hypothetical protein
MRRNGLRLHRKLRSSRRLLLPFLLLGWLFGAATAHLWHQPLVVLGYEWAYRPLPKQFLITPYLTKEDVP